jgi:hypothetical protein
VPVDLDGCERYMRQNLPRVFKSYLSQEIGEKFKEIETFLNFDILSMIRSCQDLLISEYRSRAPIDGGSQSVLSGLETNETTRGQSTVFGGLTAPDTSFHSEIPRAVPGIGIQPTPPDSETHPAIGLQQVRLGQNVDTRSKPPKNASVSNLQHTLCNVYPNLDFDSSSFGYCHPEAELYDYSTDFPLQSNGNFTMSNSMLRVDNSAMGNLTTDNTTMGNATMGNTIIDDSPMTMGNSPMGHMTMGNAARGNVRLEPEPPQSMFYPNRYSDMSNARPR